MRAVDCAHFAPPTQRTRRDGLVHCRSVPLPVALGGNDYAFVPPAAPFSSTDRLSILLSLNSLSIRLTVETMETRKCLHSAVNFFVHFSTLPQKFFCELVQNRNTDSLSFIRHPPMTLSAVFIPPTPAPLVAPRNLAPAVETSFRPLSLRCWCSAARRRGRGRVRFVRSGAALSVR